MNIQPQKHGPAGGRAVLTLTREFDFFVPDSEHN